MTKTLKRLIISLSTLSLLVVPALVPAAALAATSGSDIQGNLCTGSNLQLTPGTSTDNCSANTGLGDLQTLLTNIVNIFSVIVGVIAVIMIIVGGLRYITSGGDSNKVGAAKTTIIYALVGLVVVALAQLIVHFVLAQAQSVISNS